MSPGTHFDEHLLTAERNNYLAAICPGGRHREAGEPPSGDGVGARMSVVRYGLALVDLTTGDFKVTELAGDVALLAELERLRPAEIIYPGEAVDLPELLAGRSPAATAAGTKTIGEIRLVLPRGRVDSQRIRRMDFRPGNRSVHRARPFQWPRWMASG